MSSNNIKNPTIAGQLGRDLDPSIVAALNSQGVNIYGSHPAPTTLDVDPDLDEEAEERLTQAEIIENSSLDPAKKPLNRLIWASIPICSIVGIISFFMFGGSSSKNQVANLDPVASKPQSQKDDRDKKIEELQQKIAADNQKRDIASMSSTPSPSPNPSPSPSPSPSPTSSPLVAKPTPTPTPTPTPQIVYRNTPAPVETKIVYRNTPASPVPIPVSKTPSSPIPTRPAIIAAVPSPRPSPQSFIPLGGAGSSQNRPVRTVVARIKRKPLASENILLGGTGSPKIAVTATIVPGTTINGHLLSTLQSSGGNQNAPAATAIKVALDQPLTTTGGYQIPKGAFVSFLATINPQNGSVTAVSGNAWDRGKTIFIPQGAISIESTDKQPLIANSFAPKTGDLARADTNNAFLGAAGEVGNELTKGSSSINVGNGATIIQNSNNPNIVGAVLKGGFQTWATDQRQRTQANASKILAAQPIQYLPQGTPVILTVNSPVPIRVSQ